MINNNRIDVSQLETIKTSESPFQHFLLENTLSESDLKDLQRDLAELEKTEPSNVFKSNFGEKKEWKKFPNDLYRLNEFLDFYSSSYFIKILKQKFGISEEIQIFADNSYDGGGYVISPPGSYLSYHADFNFSNNVGKYRVLNVLFYLNQNYDFLSGGHLHLLDSKSKTVEKIILPKENTMLAFFTDDISFHGVSKNHENFFRRSFNLYYYSDIPISSHQSHEPHKTIWLDIDNHDH